MVVRFLENTEGMVDSRQKYIVQAKQVPTVGRVQQLLILQRMEKRMKQSDACNVQVSPQPLYSLVVDASACNTTSSPRPSVWVLQHEF